MKKLATVGLAFFLGAACITEAGQTIEDGVSSSPTVYERPMEQGQLAMVHRDATFFEGIGGLGRGHRAYFSEEGRREDRFAPRLLVEVVEDHGEWVEVKPAVPAHDRSSLCEARQFHRNEVVELRFFVARGDLGLTVREPVEVRYDDGTAVELLPGVSLQPMANGDQRYWAWTREFAVQVELQQEDLGLGFEPVDTWHRMSGSGSSIPSQTPIEVDGNPIDLARSSSLVAPIVDHVGERVLINVEGECGRVTASIDARDAPEGMAGWGRSSSTCGCGPGIGTTHLGEHYRIGRGTPVYWPDGEPAGEIRTPFELSPAIGSVGDRICKTAGPILYHLSDAPDEVAYEDVQIDYCFDLQAHHRRSPTPTIGVSPAPVGPAMSETEE